MATGNPVGMGGQEGLEIQVGGGMQARKLFFRGQFHGICKTKVKSAHFAGNFAVFIKGKFC